MAPLLVHATGVVIEGECVLITGPPGSGKSDLALRLIDRGAALLGDDYLNVEASRGRLVATVPQATAGLIEVRGVGLLHFDHVASAAVALLAVIGVPERLPDEESAVLCGIRLPRLVIAPLEPSAPIKVELALRRLRRPLEGSLS